MEEDEEDLGCYDLMFEMYPELDDAVLLPDIYSHFYDLIPFDDEDVREVGNLNRAWFSIKYGDEGFLFDMHAYCFGPDKKISVIK